MKWVLMNRNRHNLLRLPVITIVFGLFLAGLATGAWFIRPQEAMDRASSALQGSKTVAVSREKINGVNGFLFAPDRKGDVGLIFYPGARVPSRAYAPNALAIAEEGYRVFLVSMPLNLAVLASGRAGKVISGLPEVDRWAIGGHSMGGAMAARFVANTEKEVAGLVLWASYPPEGAEFDRDLEVLSITGSKDVIINRDKVSRSRDQFPERAEFVEIDGGNHSQFGWYGFQSGDGRADITREEQMAIITEETVGFLSSLARD